MPSLTTTKNRTSAPMDGHDFHPWSWARHKRVHHCHHRHRHLDHRCTLPEPCGTTTRRCSCRGCAILGESLRGPPGQYECNTFPRQTQTWWRARTRKARARRTWSWHCWRHPYCRSPFVSCCWSSFWGKGATRSISVAPPSHRGKPPPVEPLLVRGGRLRSILGGPTPPPCNKTPRGTTARPVFSDG